MTTGSGLFSNMRAYKPHLVEGKGGVAGEVDDLRQDVLVTLTPMAAITVEEFTNPAAGAVDSLEAATATTVAPRTVTVFEAAGLAALAAHPRNVTITTGGTTPADAPATAVVTGTYKGAAQTETLVVPQTAATVTGTKPFDGLISVAYAAADGTDATNSIGIGGGLGVKAVPKARGGGVNLVREIAVGALVTNGVLTAERLYTPNAAPNGTNDYAVYYEYVP